MKKQSFILLVLALSISSCQSQIVTSSSDNPTSVTSSVADSSNSSSSEEPFDYVTLEQALNITEDYGLTTSNLLASGVYFEIVSSSLYYYAPNASGYLILDDDQDYFHSFGETMDASDDSYSYTMNVYGRGGFSADFEKDLSTLTTMKSILETYYSTFKKTDADNIYSSTAAALGSAMKNFLQSHMFYSCNYFEVEIGKDDRLSKFRLYEKSTAETYLMGEVLFTDFYQYDYKPYRKWVDNGSVINIRLSDLKLIYNKNNSYSSYYENQKMSLDGTITALGTDGSVYLAKPGSSEIPIGIRLKTKETETIPSLKENVSVTGTLKTEGVSTYLDDVTFTDKKTSVRYLPIFDEETIVDSYGGGYYAANFFSQYPYYSGSLYNTYAYVSSIPDSLSTDSDTVIELICPNVSSYKMRYVIPSSLENSAKEILFTAFKNAGIYNTDESYELSLSNAILGFDMSYQYRTTLEATSQSQVSKRKNIQEIIDNDYSLALFPLVYSYTSSTIYHFGEIHGNYLESSYGITTTDCEGLYINMGYEDFDEQALNTYL
ncbi:MAG: hypothetical protein WCS80_00750 [Bacilli bacterium]